MALGKNARVLSSHADEIERLEEGHTRNSR
jgi:hypothetical protein